MSNHVLVNHNYPVYKCHITGSYYIFLYAMLRCREVHRVIVLQNKTSCLFYIRLDLNTITCNTLPLSVDQSFRQALTKSQILSFCLIWSCTKPTDFQHDLFLCCGTFILVAHRSDYLLIVLFPVVRFSVVS